MSHIKNADKFIQPGCNEYSQSVEPVIGSFQSGKTDHDYIKTIDELIDEFELEENNREQAYNTLSTAAANAAIMKIKSQLKILCSLQVHNSEKSSQSSSNSPILPSSQSHSTNLETSIDLPIEDNLFLDKLLNNTEISATLDDNWLDNFPGESFEKLISGNTEMTFKEFSDMPMEQNSAYIQGLEISGHMPPSNQDEITSSSNESVSEENERDFINRRGLKKSGGPVRKLARFGNKQVIKYSDEYHDRRIKNNEAVKKSRMKAKEKQKDTEVKMTQLANENRSLNDRVDLLMKELQVLKTLYRELNQDLPAAAVKELERVNVH